MERDKEWEALLAQIKQIEPSDLAKVRWKKALENELKNALKHPSSRSWWASQLAAALAVGFLLGYVSSTKVNIVKKNDPIATIQYVYDKTE